MVELRRYIGRRVLPTVTSNMWHPMPEIRKRWLNQYGKDRFTFEEAREAQTFPSDWIFPRQKTTKWKWLAEAFPPEVSQYLFEQHVHGSNLTLLDLFAGIGGWSLGAVWSGKVSKIIMVEVDRKKSWYLRKNFRRLDVDFEVINDDVRDVNFSELDFDVVVASPPCEDFSMLRIFSKKRGVEEKGTKSLTLFVLQLVEMSRPEQAFYENVYARELRELLEVYGWRVKRFDMSKIIPQKRIRLIGVKERDGRG